MSAPDIAGEIALAVQQFTLERAVTATQLRDVFRLRRQVYCVERGFEAVEGEEETDEFDSRSCHVLVRSSTDGEAVGTVRIIAPDLDATLPMQRVSEAAQGLHLPLCSTGEISRFAISKERRMSCSGAALLRMLLLRGIVELSAEMRLTHWLAVMEPSLIRLHQRNGIRFQPVGPLIEYHGLRQPAFGQIGSVLAGIRREQRTVWQFLTDGGRWFAELEEAVLAA
jgi:N-acyl-L-homoserine lactone synthetase